MKSHLKLLTVLLFCSGSILGDEAYHYSVNLTNVINDKVKVELVPPDLNQDVVEFLFPAMVPGTYEVYDFGRFVSNFTATGKDGAQIKVEKVDVNTYRLSPATKIARISYMVDDTYDKSELPNTAEKVVFEPGGTGFEDGKNFSINTHSMFGYLRGFLKRIFILEFRKPAGFYPATGLEDVRTGESTDVIRSADYHELVDSPILYCQPDTMTMKVSNTTVLVASYSPNKKITAAFITNTLRELLYAQRDYLSGQLPVNKYAFLFYFTDKQTLSGASGALEHSYSSFYVMPEFDSVALKQQLRDVAAHEFFHIVTPLAIHSEEIGEFDFNKPRMSEHLWLYEGMTEYSAHHAQVKAGLISVSDFLDVMMRKYGNSIENFNDTMSFTWMSRNVLNPKVHEQYGNVYEKGTLIGMCLDILLRDVSAGEYGTQNLMRDLAKKYGKQKSFRDQDLISDIQSLTYSEIGDFLRNHVAGKTPLPIKEILEKAGIAFVKEEETQEFSLGNPDLNYNQETGRLFVEGTDNLDAFGKALKYKRGDELSKLNGQELSVQNLRDVISGYYQNVKEGDKVTIEIYRPKGKSGKYKKKTLTTTARKVKVVRKNQVSVVKDLSDRQKLVMRTWLGG